MESSYFPKPDFQEAFSAYVLVQINTEGNEHEKRHTRRLLGGTYSLPTYAVIAADGTLLAATGWTGGTDPGGTLLAWIRAPVAGADDVTQALRKGVWSFCLFAAGWGLATLLTPCVYPMVPVTIAFFSKQEKTGRASLVLAALYSIGIIGMFTVLGIAVSVLMKEHGGVASFGNNPWVNLFVGAVFVVFAFALFGAFELKLPSGLVNRVAGGGRTGYAGALFLGFVFSVSSFACTAPFAASVLGLGVQSGNWLLPGLGMAVFSATIALPFFFLAAFPGMLRTMPRSGGWMETVKHVCAFVELGAALKFLGAADIGLLEADLFTRPVVVALWGAICAATGLYLLGAYRFHGEKDEGIGSLRVLIGTSFLALAVYFAAGLSSGARLGPWESFLTAPEVESGTLGASPGGS